MRHQKVHLRTRTCDFNGSFFEEHNALINCIQLHGNPLIQTSIPEISYGVQGLRIVQGRKGEERSAQETSSLTLLSRDYPSGTLSCQKFCSCV